MPAIQLLHVSKSFGKKRVLHEIDLSFEAGKTTVLTGPNGSGKSTLLRMIMGLEEPDSGDLRIDDRSLLKTPPHLRPIGMLAQLGGYYEQLSVRENLTHSLQSLKLSRQEFATRIAWLGSVLGIDSLLDTTVAHLSGGQIQRVALARSLAKKPRVLLLDEPLNHLDWETRHSLHQALRNLQRDLGLTILYVTHDSHEALTMADELVVIDRGTVQQIGSPQHIYDQPANRWIAQMFGRPPMHLTKGRIVTRPDGFELQLWHLTLRLNQEQVRRIEPIAAGASSSFEVVVGIRPEQLSVETSLKSGNGTCTIEATLREHRFAGDVWSIECELEGGEVFQICLPRGETEAWRIGDKVRLQFDPNCLCILEAS